MADELSSWFVRFSRFATTHLVRAQDGQLACGIASSMMVCCRMNKIRTLQKAIYSEKEVYKKYTAATGLAYDGTQTAERNEIAQLLNTLDIGIWEGTILPQADVAGAIIDASSVFKVSTVPIIVGITWTGGGGHWVMIDQVFNVAGTNYAIVNDPGDGNIHILEIKRGQVTSYQAKPAKFSVDFWGAKVNGTARRLAYGAGSVGTFDGHMVRCNKMSATQRVAHAILS